MKNLKMKHIIGIYFTKKDSLNKEKENKYTLKKKNSHSVTFIGSSVCQVYSLKRMSL